jgi:hypothetical protein
MDSTFPADLLKLKARFETWRTNRKYVRESILRGASLGGESERAFFAFFKIGCRNHTVAEASTISTGVFCIRYDADKAM